MFYIVTVILMVSSVYFISSRLLQLVLLFMLYPIFCMSFMSYSGEMSRIVAAVGSFYYYEYFDKAYLYQVFFYFAMYSMFFFIRKKKFSLKRIPIGNIERGFIFTLLLCIYPIAYPAIFGSGSERFGGGGSLLVILNAIMLMSRRERLGIVDYACMALNIYALLAGERADTILIVFLYYITLNRKGYIVERDISVFKLSFLLFAIMFIGLFSGINRMGGQVSIEYFTYYLFNQGTAIDVLHVYLSSLWYVNAVGFSYEPILNFIFSFIPLNPLGGASSDLNVTQILRSHIPNVGGGLFYTIGLVTGGFIGGLISVLGYSAFIVKMFTGSDVLKILFISLFIQQLRLQWYGLTYMGNVISVGVCIILCIYFIRYVSGRT